MAFTSSETGAAGNRRMKEIAAKNAVEIKALAIRLLTNLARPTTAADEILAEVVASAVVRSRYKRKLGKDDQLERHQIASLLHHFPSLRRSLADDQPAV
jgi:hypothetical protein